MSDKEDVLAILIDAVFPAGEAGSVEDPRRTAALDALGRGAPAAAADKADEPDADDAEDYTKAELMDRAAELEIEGRSSMNKAELQAAIEEAEAEDG